MIGADELLQMMIEIQRGDPDPPGEDAEHREAREGLRADIAEIEARSGVVDLPPEIP